MKTAGNNRKTTSNRVALYGLLIAVCKKLRLFDMTGISIIGGVAHNIGQFLVAAFVTKTFGVFSYLPVLLIAGTVAGALIGLLGGIILKRISRILPKG